MGASQASASNSRSGFYGDRISAILYRHAVDSHSEHLAQTTAANATDPETLLTPAPALAAAFHFTWTMRPPSAHSAALFAETSFARPAFL